MQGSHNFRVSSGPTSRRFPRFWTPPGSERSFGLARWPGRSPQARRSIACPGGPPRPSRRPQEVGRYRSSEQPSGPSVRPELSAGRAMSTSRSAGKSAYPGTSLRITPYWRYLRTHRLPRPRARRALPQSLTKRRCRCGHQQGPLRLVPCGNETSRPLRASALLKLPPSVVAAATAWIMTLADPLELVYPRPRG
jgi:hypothetical protein